MTSSVDLCNRALLSIGARAQISSISPSDGSTEADACAVLYTPVFESLARAAKWNCLRQQASLTLLQAAQGTPENPSGGAGLGNFTIGSSPIGPYPTPAIPWLYGYLLPADCLMVRAIVPSLPSSGTGIPFTSINNSAPTMLPSGGAIPFAVAYSTDANNNPVQIILTNQDQAQAVYTLKQPNPGFWDSLFQEAFVSSLAAYLVPALSLHMPLMQLAIQRAEGLISRARAQDANEGVHVMDHLPDWMRARGGEGGLPDWPYLWTNNGYVDVAWPNF